MFLESSCSLFHLYAEISSDGLSECHFSGAIFSSFYRTVWAMAFIGSVSIIKLRYALLLVLMALTVIAFNFDLLFSAFKLTNWKFDRTIRVVGDCRDWL